ncbi:unnamed protein product [Rotaria magnacalcarata]|uniref:Cytochrome P450 n=1 Tax=Rotaria magnacalcarata TaxID=392030 RepID=A0A819QCW4_9BILA|nr:unnamed protein product [Rotaria magnacalcarata]CAF2067276.1 unnamed protein product [Rotaria magnacalcarata]CAF3987838.1 unnamed protein product [Rotaria magnacalcarata]CAF4028751.1 unnamed protein product [Rotaria magnacalcarata]
MLLILFTIIIVTLITYIYIKPLIDNLFYSVPYEPKYIHSYLPIFGFTFEVIKNPIEFIRSLYLKYGKTFVIRFASKRFVYLYDEQSYLTKVAKSDNFTFFDAFIAEVFIKDLNVNPQCLLNEEYQNVQMKYFHHYLTGDELNTLNKRGYDSLIESMKLDANILADNNNKIVNFFDLFGEFMLFSATESLFGHSFAIEQRNTTPSFYKLFQALNQAHMLGIYGIPFRSIIYKTLFQQRNEFLQRFSSFRLNSGESKLIHAIEELLRSDEYKHLFRQHDINALHVSLLWLGMTFTAPMSCWAVVDLFLHPEALAAVKEELNENISSSSFIYDKEVLTKLKILDSCINETIRRVFQAVSVREAVKNTTIECLDKTKEDHSKVTRSIFYLPNICQSVRQAKC